MADNEEPFGSLVGRDGRKQTPFSLLKRTRTVLKGTREETAAISWEV